MRPRTTPRAILATALVAASALVFAPERPAAADAPGPQVPVANPEMVEACGADVVLVLDASGSIQSSHAVENVRAAGEAFLDALADTGSSARVLQFASLSEQLAAQAEVTAGSLQTGGAFREALNRYYNPIPPRPSSVTIHSFRGGNPQSAGSFTTSNGSNQYTNWDGSLRQAGEPQAEPTELVVYVTDGDPTSFDFDQPGDPFPSPPPPDVAVGTDSGSGVGSASQTTLDRAVQEANRIKTADTRMLAVGVGKAVTGSPASRERLVQIAGPQVATDADLPSLDSINDVDVALVQDFAALAQFLRGVVNQLCTPSLSIRKLAQTAGDAEYLPAEDWDITVTPTVEGGTWTWILPDSDAAARTRCGVTTPATDGAPRTCPTDATGIAAFQWEPDPSDAATSALVEEAGRPGYVPGRPPDTPGVREVGVDEADWRCTLKNNDGTQEIVEGDFADPQAPSFVLDVDPEQIVTCTIWNSFVYEPDIALVKEDLPTPVRGDLDPTITSTFTVTNPGNTPLADVVVTDDRCADEDIVFVGGDDNGDDRLDTDETWTFTCERTVSTTAGEDPVSITNTAEVTGVDPTGRQVSDEDDATVEAYAPAISLVKTADPTVVEVGTPTDVTYTYVVTNTGNMTLEDVTIVDEDGDTPCGPVTLVTGSTTLAPGDAATFECTLEGDDALLATSASDTFTNAATVSGDPVFPGGAPAPPEVTDVDTQIITAFQPGIALEKSADRSVVLPGTDVTYTYEVTNTGTAALVIPDDTVPPVGSVDPRDGWVVDARGPTGSCAEVFYVSGDDGDDEVLSPGETWEYTCTTTITGALPVVRNTAVVVGQVQGSESRVSASAIASVEVARPEIVLEKTAARPVVLDPGAPALLGPDVPTPRPELYRYLLRNTGNVTVQDPVVTDTFPLGGSNECPMSPVPPTGDNAGDVNGNGELEPGETWEFQCEITLAKADGDVTPSATTPTPVTNTATASGTAHLVDGEVEQTAPVSADPVTQQVLVIWPAISLSKIPCLDGAGGLVCDADLLVRTGTDVTYEYSVNNDGDSPLRVVSGIDDRCDVVEYVSGDTDGDELLDVDESPWIYHCTTEVAFPSPVVNEAGVLASGPLGNLYGDLTQASVRIFQPAIELTKTVSDDLVPVGSEVTYTFEVTNAGTVGDDGLPADVVLAQIGLSDVSRPPNPGCSSPAFVGGDDGDGLLELEPAEVWTYECTGVIEERTVDAAGVVGTDIQGGNVVDAATATVTPFETGIDVTKTADPTSLPVGGGPVTYTYEVRNTGNVPLADVTGRVTDDRCDDVAPVEEAGFNVGDVDRNDLLTGIADLFETGAEEVWEFTCTTVITEDTVNTVTAIGTPVHPVTDEQGQPQLEVLAADVTAQATAEVTVPVVDSADDVGPATLPANLPRTGLGEVLQLVAVALAGLAVGAALQRRAQHASSSDAR